MLIAGLIGFVLGMVSTAPVAGPIAALVFARGLEHRFKSAWAIGAGGAVAEAGYVALAFWGFATFLAQHPFVVPVSRAVGAAVLIALGLHLFRRQGEELFLAEPVKERHTGSFLLGLSITALNPTLMVTWTTVATVLFSLNLIKLEPLVAAPMALGVAAGVMCGYAVLLNLVSHCKERFHASTLARGVRLVGVMLIGLGLALMVMFGRFVADNWQQMMSALVS